VSAVRTSIVYSSLNSWFTVAFQLATTVVVARVLTPEQTGIFAVAAVFAAVASTFRDFGVGEYLIQEKELTPEVIRAALTVNIGVSWFMAVLLFLGAPFAGDFYRTAGVGDAMRVLAVNFLLIPFGAVAMAWFRREMNFKPILIIGLAANAVSFVVAVVMALKGFGYMSLAWSSLAGVVVSVIGSAVMRPKGFPWKPGLKGVGKVLHFGKFVSGIYIFGQLGKGAPEMVLGRALDMASVGIFSRAAGLVEIFHRLVLRAILPVCLPYFAKGVRADGSPVRGLLLTMSHLTVIGWTFLAFMAVYAYSSIRILYGPQWTGAVGLAQILCAAAAFELLYCTSKEAMLSVGKAKESNNLQIATESLRLLGVFAVVPFGLVGACWGLLAASLLGALTSHWVLHRVVKLRFRDVLVAVMPSLGVTALATAPLLLLTLWIPIDESNYVRMVVGGVLFTTITWVLALRFLRHPMWAELHAGAGNTWARLRSRGVGS
jgi:O-antigen/teichoic acid export membrane protein